MMPYDDRDEHAVDTANQAACDRLLELLREHHRPEEVLTYNFGKGCQ
jgi:hypothetical protein